MKESFSILHFNDCYNLDPVKSDPVGGVSKFTTLLHQYQNEKKNSITTFGGDVFSPSTCISKKIRFYFSHT